MRNAFTLVALAAGLVNLAACRPRGPIAPSRPNARAPIVVAVVLDQVGSWVLENAREDLDEAGPLRRAMEHGAYHRVRYNYAGTYTAPGHAMIHTGAPPEQSGIVANRIWARERRLSAVDDGVNAVHNHAGAFAAPTMLRVETVSDALRAHTQNRGRVVSVSMKDRGAVLPGGRRPDVCVWYDEDARGFTTSAYYAPAGLPPWLLAWQRAHPIDGLFTTWNALPTTRMLDPDDAPGEGNWHGLGVRFPHELSRASAPYAALLATPMGTDALFDLALTAAHEAHVGEDEVPDLVAVSVSGTDYAGHVFGPNSNEARDHLARADRALGRFVRALEATGAPVTYLVTADHGVAELPERTRASGRSAQRIDWDVVRERANEGIARVLGPGNWAAAFVQPFLYLTPAARAPGMRDRAVSAAVEALRSMPGIGGAHDVREARSFATSPDALRRMISRSVPADIERAAGADVFAYPARGSVVDEEMPEGSGTSHGSPWEYDTDVPALVYGPGISAVNHSHTEPPAEPARVARTLAALLGVPPPEAARSATVLDGVSSR